MERKKKMYRKIALAFCLLMAMLWTVMGTGASLAWFRDQDEVKNIINLATFQPEFSWRDEQGNWKPLTADTELFDANALYEPGYTQVVYLKVKNAGTVPFDFRTAVRVTDFTEAINVYGQRFHLQDYLTFGLLTAASEAAIDEQTSSRKQVADCAVDSLGNYATNYAPLKPMETVYIALVVRMPEKVDNAANYRGDVIPRVELGVTVTAVQQGTAGN